MSIKGANKTEKKMIGGINRSGVVVPAEETAEGLLKSLKEISDYKYALNESSIVAITDQKGIITHVNDNFCKISKYSRAELLGQDHRIINSGYHAAEFIRDLWVTIANGKIWKGELRNKAKDGTFYWVDTTIVPFLDDKGKPYQYIAIRADITRRKKLEEEQALAAAIVNFSDDGIFSKTLGGIITSWNHGAEKIFGYTAKEIIDQHISTLIPPYLWSEEYEIIESIRRGKIINHYETQRVRKDGTLIHVSLTISPLKDADGNITGASKIVRDITKQKNAEQQLTKTIKEITDYRFALDESSIVAITDQKGIIQYVNNNFCKISKYTAEELVGRDHRIINSGHHPKEFIKNLWTTIANGKIWKGEMKNMAKDGTVYWVDTTIVPFLDEKEKPYQYVAIRSDITERKRAEEKLIESEKQYRHLFENNPMPMWIIDSDTFKFLDVNNMAVMQYGYSRQDFFSMTAADIRPEEDKLHFKNLKRNDKTDVTNYNKGIWKHLKKDGTIILAEIIAHEIIFEGTKARLILAHNVTEQKKTEQEIQKLNEELEQKVISRTEQLRKTNEELEAFSYSVSHDLRAPLRAIIGFSAILQEDYIDMLDEEAKRITNVIINNTKKMGQLIDDLLTFSRLGRQEILKSTIATDEMVKAIVAEMDDNGNKAKKINWVIHFLPPIMGDINTIRQVWINLISNAVKYSAKADEPAVEIGTCMQEGQIAFFVKDNGVGFDEKYKIKLFGVFQRLHSADEFDGTGIGLAIVEKVISKHGGKVWAEGKPGKGACFYFSLPDVVAAM